MEAHGYAARNDARACGTVLARAEQTFDRAARYARRSPDMDGRYVQTVLISQNGHENGRRTHGSGSPCHATLVGEAAGRRPIISP
jgi:hypothetical protein